MYYLLALLLFVISYYVLVKVLSSVIKGCLFALMIAALFFVVTLFIRSSKEPVEILNMYRIDNFEIERIVK